jgi:hypothetical protein
MNCCEVCGEIDGHSPTCRPLEEVLAEIDRLNAELQPFFDSLPNVRYHHLTCGWSGDDLQDGQCPKCGEPYP